VSIVSKVRRPTPPGAFDRAIGQLAAQVAAEIGDGVMLLPPLPRAAPPHGWTTFRPWAMGSMVPANLFGWPATQIPMGIGREGLPLGVQAMAPMDQDHRSIAIALELERAFGGWVPPEQADARRPVVGPGERHRVRDRVRAARARTRRAERSA
jgi:Asp-tRNA(Asn)/Glu-tRNA(Gln) amidotransferase A subunit family amidase